MFSRKIVVSLVALAVFAAGGVATVYAVAQPNEKVTVVQDITDPNYAENFSEEQLRMNELFNQSIYRQIAEDLEIYEPFGLSYDSENNQLYFDGVPVRYFVDNTATDGSFEGTEIRCKLGNVGVAAERDATGNLTGLKQLDEKEISNYYEGDWKEQK